jgi:hypothetical protein
VYVLVAYGYGKAELPRASERVGSNIGTTRVIAKIFCEQFFAPVWSLEARLDRYLRNGDSPDRLLALSMRGGRLVQVEFWCPDREMPVKSHFGTLS